MKNILTFILLFCFFLVNGQDEKPVDTNFKILQAPNSPVFGYFITDSTVWVYKGIYGWTKLTSFRDVENLINALETYWISDDYGINYADGNVAIGTTNTGIYKLHVETTTQTHAILGYNNNTNDGSYGVVGFGRTGVYGHTAHDQGYGGYFVSDGWAGKGIFARGGSYGAILVGGSYGADITASGQFALGLTITATGTDANGVTSNSTLSDFKATGSGVYEFKERVSAPVTPSTNYGRMYVKTDGKIYFKNDGGTEYDLTSTGGTLEESDPIFTASPAFGITSTNITNWGTAFGWGDHSLAGYLTSESDPVFGAHTTSNIVDGIGFLKNNGTGTWSWDNSVYSLYNHKHTLNSILSPDGNTTWSMGGNTLTYTFTNPVGGMLLNMTGGWSGHVFEIMDNSVTPSAAGDHLLHIETSRENVIPAHFVNNHISGHALHVEGVAMFDDDISANSFTKVGGTSSQFLKADGSVDISTYLTSNQTITLSGDVSGSGTTSITTTVANDSHTHDTRYFTETESDSRYLQSFTESDPIVKAINGLVKSNGTTIGAVVSGTDIKTINSTSILGSGNISIAPMVYPGTGIPLSTGSAWGTSITNNSSNWNTAYTDRFKWDGGSTGLTASTGRTSLGGTTVGQNIFTSTNPSAVTFLRANADNTVSWLDAVTFRTAIGAGTSSTVGTVTSVEMTVPTGLSISGSPITSSGTLGLSYSAGYSIPPHGTGFLKDNGTGAWSYDNTNYLNTAFSYNSTTRELLITDGGGDLSLFLPIVTDIYPGLMSTSDKDKLNSLSINSNTVQVSQTAHGLVAGDWIRNSATGHLKAQANLPVNADVIGRVTEVIDVNTFVYQYGGVLAGTFTNGANYFLSTATAGAAVTSQSYSDGQVQVFLGTGTADGLLMSIGTGVEISTDTYVTTDQLKTDVYNEVPTGTINGTNAAFTIANTPVAGSVRVYLNGLREKLTSNYSVSGTTITFVTAPETGDEIIVDYKY